MMETASWEDFFADISENIFLLLDGAAIPTLWSALHSIEKKWNVYRCTSRRNFQHCLI